MKTKNALKETIMHVEKLEINAFVANVVFDGGPRRGTVLKNHLISVTIINSGTKNICLLGLSFHRIDGNKYVLLDSIPLLQKKVLSPNERLRLSLQIPPELVEASSELTGISVADSSNNEWFLSEKMFNEFVAALKSKQQL